MIAAGEQAPAIPGLAFRRFRGEADFPGMAALLRLYQSIGYQEMHRHTFYRKPLL